MKEAMVRQLSGMARHVWASERSEAQVTRGGRKDCEAEAKTGKKML